MINYILQVILFQVLFLAVYDLFLSKETFFTKNRWYLLATPILSFVIPFIKIPTFQKAVSEEYIVFLPEIILSPEKVIQQTEMYASINYLALVFWCGVVFFSIVFSIKFLKILRLIQRNESVKKMNFILILLPKESKAFSFFKYIFLGKEIPKNQQEKVIEHELIHCKQNHSLDLIFFEFLKIAMWFNPIIYIYQKRITLVHEYISDDVFAKTETKQDYINNLLSSFFQVENISFVNQFFKQTFIKKRIIMMTKNKSKKMNQLKYLVLIPVLVSMLFYSSCSENIIDENVESKKELQKMYFLSKDNKMEVFESKNKYSYYDHFIGYKVPSEFIEISQDKLTLEEENEFKNMFKETKKRGSQLSIEDYKFYQMKSGRKILISILGSKYFSDKNPINVISETGEVSFMSIEKVPTFPGCEEGDRACFSNKVQKHFIKNFDSKLPNQLNLSSGKKRIFVLFKINKEGNVVDIKAKAPHKEIEKEVIRVMKSLPKMIPGEQEDGKKVAVKYTIPFVISVE